MKKICFLFTVLLIIVFALVSCHDDPVVKVQQTPTIRGSVSIPEGSGLTGSDFFVRVMEGEKAVYTGKVGSNGSFSVTGLKEDVSYSLLLTTEEPGDIKGTEKEVSRAATSGYGGWLSDVSAAISEDANIGSVKVKPLGTIRGVVRRDGAEDGYDTTVYIPGTSYMAMTDANGNYSIFNVPQSTYTLRYISNGYMARMVDDVVLYSADDKENPVTTVPEQVLIKNAGNLVGAISKAGSTDHSNITVVISDGEYSYTGGTGEDGSLLISSINPGTYVATISSSGFITQTVENIKIEASKTTAMDPLSLVANGGSIIGSIALNNNGDKAGVQVTAKSEENGYSYIAGTDSEGMYIISNAFPGTYTVTISKVGYSSITIEGVSTSAGQVTELGLEKLYSLYGNVSGKVSLADSVDNSGVIITLKSIDNPSISPATLSGVDGVYSFENLTMAGQYTLTFSKDGFVSDSGTTVTVQLGVNNKVEDVTLRSLSSKITGAVVLEGTDNHAGVSVLLKSSDGKDNQYTSTTDITGSFTLSGVIPGIYDLYVSKSGYETITSTGIVVESSTEKVFDSVNLTAKIKSITGSVTLEGKDDYAGALVTATSLSDDSLVYSAITNSDGNYTLAGMLAGEYRIVITNTAYRSETLRTVSLSDEPIVIGNVDMIIARGTIYGSVRLEGRSDNSGVKVEIIGKTGEDYVTTTDMNGEYSFYVPQGNYAGIRASKEDFQTETTDTVISLFAENEVPIENLKLAATHVTIYGTVSVYQATSYSGVSVSFDDYDVPSVVTSDDGAFRFDHIPVGATYTLRFARENTADITLRVEAKASDGIRINDVVLVPDAAGVEGIVKLTPALNNGNVVVSIDTGFEVLSTTTNYAGAYYIGGIPTGRELTIEFSKEGWTSGTQTIDALAPLEVRKLDDVSLSDVTAPVLSGIEINGGSNVTGSRLVSVKINASDKGSGISEMRYWWNDDSSSAIWTAFNKTIKVELPDDSNGKYTLYLEIRDAAGNVSEAPVSDSIELVGQITTIQPGILSGDNLHWQAKDNPYVIMGDVVVQSKDTLIIDPGVDVVFNGNYSIKVLGKIQAVGTEELPIVFDSSKNHLAEVYQNEEIEGYDGYWGGIIVSNDSLNVSKESNYKCTFVDGSILSYCKIYNLSDGVTGKVFIDHCHIETQKSAIGKYSGSKFYGYLLNSYINGSVAIENNYTTILGNTFDGTGLPEEPSFEYLNHWDNGIQYRVARNWYEYGYDSDGNYSNRNISEFDFNGIYIEGNTIINNKIRGYNAVRLNPVYEAQFNTIESCRSLSIVSDDNDRYWAYNDIHDISDAILFEGTRAFTFNNIYDISGDYVIKVVSGNSEYVVNYGHNYWGDFTSELVSIDKYGFGNPSFVYDGYSDTNISILDLTDYAVEPWSFAGYQGDNLIVMAASYTDGEVKRGNDVNLKVDSLTDNQIDEYRVSQSVSGLLRSDYSTLTGSSFVVPYSSFDADLLDSEGYLTFYVQGRSGDAETSIISVRLPYDSPRISNTTMPSGIEYKNDSVGSYSFRIADAGDSYIPSFRVYIDEMYLNSGYSYTHWDNGLTINPTQYRNGEHKVRIEIQDRAGNESRTEIPFTINRPTPSVKSLVFGNNGTVAENGTLTISLKIENAKHLKEVRFYSDGFILTTTCYSDDNSNTLENSYTIDGHYLKAGSHKLVVELEDYAGNVTKSSEYSYAVEGSATEGPVISSISIKNNDTVGNSGTVSVSASAVKGVRAVYVSVGDKQIGSNDGRYLTYSSDYDSRVVATTLDFTGVKDGKNELTFTVVDFAGNETTATRTVNVAKTYPSVNMTVHDKQQTFYVSTTVSDVSLLDSVKVYAGEELVETYDVSFFGGSFVRELTKSKSEYADGTYEISVVLINKLDEKKTVESGTNVVIDNTKVFDENNLAGVTTFSGMLSDDERLHWTEEMSPIVITGNVTVASDKTLVIDPGVKVYFDGNYSISVRGLLDAQGTAEKPIELRSSGNLLDNHEGYYGNWGGVSVITETLDVSINEYSCTFNSGNIMKYCNVFDMSTGITGAIFIDSCILSSNSYALGNGSYRFRGIVTNSTIYGYARFEHNRLIFNNVFDGSGNNRTSDYGFYYYTYYGEQKIVNNLITGYDSVYIRVDNSQFEFNTIENVGRIQFECCYNNMRYNTISNVGSQISFGSNVYGMKFSNITGLSGSPQIKVSTRWNERESHDFTNNYWGAANTTELDRASRSASKNASFIFDGYDDNDYSVIDWNGYVSEAWGFAGYKGDSFIDFNIPNVSEVLIGNDITIRINPVTTSELEYVRVTQTPEEIQSAQWQVFNGNNVTIEGASIDRNLISEDGYLTIYVQAKNSEYETAIKSVKIPSDCPRIELFSVSSAVIEDDSNVRVSWSIRDYQDYGSNGSSSFVKLYLDDIVVSDWDGHYIGGGSTSSTTLYVSNYKNGNHVLKLELADRAGNESSAEIPFTIARPVPTTEGLTFGNDSTTIPENGSLDVSLEITNAKHLRYVRFYSDGINVLSKSYNDNGDDSRTVSYQLDAHYLKAGTHKIYGVLEDYSGNTTRTEEYEYTVEGDASGPVFSASTYSDGDMITNPDFWCQVTINAVKGVKRFYVYLDGELIRDNWWSDSYSSDRIRQNDSFSINFGDREDGEVVLSLKAVDFAGNETVETMTLNLQKAWPTVNVTVYDKKTSFSIKPDISSVNEINYVRVFVGGEQIKVLDLRNYEGSWTNEIAKAKSDYTIGEYFVEVEVENRAGETKSFAGNRTIVVDDLSGFEENNLEGVTTISGVLNVADRLHWTAEKSPWVVTGNITVASGKTLVIDSGVEVLFEGDYSINAKGGSIDARGTEEAPIIFRSSANHVENHDGYYAGWSGINMPDSLSVHVDGYSCSFNSGSILEYCQISDLSDGITGRAYIRNCSIESSGYAVGKNNGNNFNGVLLNNQINGSVRINDNLIVFGNRFNGNSAVNSNLYIWNHTESNKIVNNDISDFDSADLYLYYCMFEFNTMKDFSGNIRVWRYENSRGTKYNEFDNISGTIYLESPSNGFQYGSFTNLKGNPQIYVDAGSGSSGSFDLSYNYWGAAGTAELRRAEASAEMNASFIHDGYDQSNLALAVWDGFVSEAWEYAGYKGDGFIDFEATLIQEISTVNEIKIGNDIPFKLTLKSGGIIGEYRIAQSIEELLNNEWIPYAGYCTLDAEDIDTSALIDGTVKAFIQIRTDSGFESAPVACAVSYDVPTITFNAIKDGDVITSSSLIPIQADFYDASNYTHFMTYIDGVMKCEGGYGYLGNGHYNIWGGYPWTTDPANMGENDYLDPAIYGNGVHTLTIFAEDRVGNSTTTVVNFTIQITPPTLTAVEFIGGSSIGEGETLKISVRIDDAENLASVRLLSDGKEIVTKDTTQRLPTFSEIFSLSSDYLRSGTHSIQIIMDDRSGESYASDLFEYTAEGDDSAPTIEGFDVGEGHVFTENSVEVWTLDVTDDTGIKSILFDIDGTRIYQYTAKDIETSEKEYEAKARFKVYGYGNGSHTLAVTASDFAGNETTMVRTIVVNKTLPTATLYKYEETEKCQRYYAVISRRAWIRDAYILLDGEILKYWNVNSNSDEEHSESYWTDYLYFDNLPSGTHTVQAVFYTQGGDRIESNELTFTNEREKNDARYGLNKTWNADGSLIADGMTMYLWNFDDDMGVNYESVSEKNLGTVKALTKGLGSKAGSLYYDTSDQMTFYNSEWTVEYWAKDEYGGTDCIDIDIRGVLDSNNDHNSMSSESLINAWCSYTIGISDDSSFSDGISGARSSRADRSDWHHYAIVSTGDRFEIYMDGILTCYTGGNKSSKKTSNGLYISMTSMAYVDELRISDTARSGDELWDYVQYVKNNNLLPE